jgi:hypothetical protein
MTKSEVLAWIDAETGLFPERASGNEIGIVVAQRIRPLIEEDRSAVIEALRERIGLRVPEGSRKPQDSILEARLFLALHIAAANRLVELREDLRALIADVRDGKSFLPYYLEIFANYEKRLA